MKIFMLFELVIVLWFLILVINILRYVYYKESKGCGYLFRMSDKWIKQQKKGD